MFAAGKARCEHSISENSAHVRDVSADVSARGVDSPQLERPRRDAYPIWL